MRAVQINAYGGNEVVTINRDAPKLATPAGGVLVEVRAAGVNPADWKMREGYFQQMAPLNFPATLGGDFSGVVVEVGKEVSGFKPGDEVYGQAMAVGGGSGSFAEFVAAPGGGTGQKPRTIDYVQAAALPLAGVSALQALTEHIKLTGKQKILIHGGAGGIGTMAIQLAKHLGAYVVTTAMADEEQYVKDLGADEVIDYQQQRFEEAVRECDAVFDTVGGETYTRSFVVLKRGGVIVSMVEQPVQELMGKFGVTAISQFTRVTSARLAKLAALVDQGVLKVRVAEVFPLEQAGEALSQLQAGRVRGKVVLRVKE